MSQSNTGRASGGIGFMGALFLVFLALKLTHFINWSWWYVTAPLWGIPAFVAAFALAIGVVWALAFIYNRTFDRQRWLAHKAAEAAPKPQTAFEKKMAELRAKGAQARKDRN